MLLMDTVMPEIQENIVLAFEGIEIFDFHFNVQRQYDRETPVKVNITPKLLLPPEDNTHEFSVLMETELEAEGFFTISLSAVGKFAFRGEVDETTRETFTHINAAAIMFPYIRAFISSVTTNAGSLIGPITLPIHFFNGKLDKYEPPQPPNEAQQLDPA